MKHVTQDNFLSDGTTDLSFSRSQEQTAVDFEGLAGNPSPVVRGQERDCIGDVGWTAGAAERCHSRNTLDRFHVFVPDGRIHVCVGNPGRNCVHGNIATA